MEFPSQNVSKNRACIKHGLDDAALELHQGV
jgi:hypothetical protein